MMFMVKKPGEEVFKERHISEMQLGDQVLLNLPKKFNDLSKSNIIEGEFEVVKERQLLEKK